MMEVIVAELAKLATVVVEVMFPILLILTAATITAVIVGMAVMALGTIAAITLDKVMVLIRAIQSRITGARTTPEDRTNP
jgi:hypothetical protein